MPYVICPSPLAKIYLPEWHDRLLDNPELIYDNKSDFIFDIVTGTRAIKIRFNKPVALGGANDKDIAQLFGWLTGEIGTSQHETDIYGIVEYNPGVDLVERQEEIAQLDDLVSDDPKAVAAAQKRVAEIQADTQNRLRAMKEGLVKKAEVRIKRAMKTVHNNLVRQWQINEEQKMGKYPASISEMLGAFALDKEIKASEAKGSKLKSRMNEMMGNIST